MRSFQFLLISALLLVTSPAADAQITLLSAGQTGGGGSTFSGSRSITVAAGGVDAGVVRLAMNVSAEDPSPDVIPRAWDLAQNYPNPFSGRTTIAVDVPRSAHVNLVVFDMTGRAIRSLADGVFEAGQHRFTFNASGLSAGIYLYRIRAGDHSDTRRMVVLR